MFLNSIITKLLLIVSVIVSLTTNIFGISINAEVKDTSFYFRGYTSPNSLVYFREGGIIIGTTSSDENGLFEKYILAVDPGLHSIDIWSVDIENTPTSIINFDLLVLPKQELGLLNIYLPATVSILDNYIDNHEDIFIWGYAKPNEDIKITLTGDSSYEYTVSSDSDGYYSLTLPSDDYPNGDYSLTTEVLIDGIIDNPTISDPIIFTLDNPPLPTATPSPTPSPSVTPSITPTLRPGESIIPTLITITPSTLPSITLTPTIQPVIPELPRTGVSEISLLISIILMFLILLFLMLSIPQFILLAIVFMRLKQEQKIFGVITDRYTFKPIPFALIRVYDENGKLMYITLSDLEGKYHLMISKGNYTIVISHSSYKQYRSKLIIDHNSYNLIQNYSLIPKSNPNIFEMIYSYLEHTFTYYFIFIWLLGFILSLIASIDHTLTITNLILIIYLVEIIVFFLIKRKNTYGAIYDVDNDKGVKGIPVIIYSENGKLLKDMSITNDDGIFSFKLDNKDYLLLVDTNRKIIKNPLVKSKIIGFSYSKNNKDIKIGIK